ncbi:MAG: choice-of-anchor tandem repeat NxxGxxAF-containing protein [Planctomycetota bacterium]
MNTRISTRVLLSVSLALCAGQGAAQGFVFATLARDGQPLPGFPNGVSAETVRLQGLDRAGGSGVLVQRAGPGITSANDFGYWSSDGSSPFTSVIQEGEQAPGFPAGVIVSRVRDGEPRENGKWAIRGDVSGPGITPGLNDLVIWVDDGSGLGPVPVAQRETDSPPGFPSDASYNSFSIFDSNNAGYVAFGGRVRFASGLIREGAFLYQPDGTTRLLARELAPLPGVTGISTRTFSVGERAIDSNGNAVFFVGLPRPAGFPLDSNFAVVLSRADGTTEFLARSADPAAGFPAGFIYDTFDRPIISDSGKILFTATVFDDVGQPAGAVLYAGTSAADLRVVASTGLSAPGFPAGSVFDNFGAIFLRDTGEVTFNADVLVSNDVTFADDGGIWSESSIGTLELLVREGDQVPTLPAGSTFIVGANRSGEPPVVLSTGDLVFEAGVRNGPPGVGVGVWRRDASGDYRVVTSAGSPINIVFNGQSEQQTVTRVNFTSFKDVLEDGRIALDVQLDGGGSAIIIAEPAPDCAADVNGDGDATPADFNAWVAAFNSQAPECDQNGDGLCDPSDFNAWILNFNAGC